jgi:hypothetical protein
MKKFAPILLLILSSITCYSQEIIYEDSFDNNYFQWESPGKKAGPVFNNGKMILKGSSEEDIAMVLSQILLDPGKDFSISFMIEYAKGPEESSFGLILSDESHTKEPRYYFFMLFPPDGFEMFYSRAIGADLRFVNYYPRQKIKNLAMPAGDSNQFLLKNTGGLWEYFVNGQKAWSKTNPAICINSIGFFTMGYLEIGVDQMEIRQDGWHDIDLADESLKSYEKENLGEGINTAATELLPIISADGQTLYLCGQDLYVSHRKADGSWSQPLNMGPDINTFGDEMAPFLATDNTTLYFATYARPGYGNHDIFITRRLDDSWASWSAPANMGPNINTPGGDAYFTIPASGEYSYLVSSSGIPIPAVGDG